jgi:hypothetical protein
MIVGVHAVTGRMRVSGAWADRLRATRAGSSMPPRQHAIQHEGDGHGQRDDQGQQEQQGHFGASEQLVKLG